MFIFKNGNKYIGSDQGYLYETDNMFSAKTWLYASDTQPFENQIKESWTLHEIHGYETSPVGIEPDPSNDTPTPRITREEAEKWVADYPPEHSLTNYAAMLIINLLDQIYGFDSKGKPVEPITIPKG